jgi:hypothetical protein
VVSVVETDFLRKENDLMRVLLDQSNARKPTVELVAAIANYTATPEEFLKSVARFWPHSRVYRGHTHFRVMLIKNSEAESVYVELA